MIEVVMSLKFDILLLMLYILNFKFLGVLMPWTHFYLLLLFIIFFLGGGGGGKWVDLNKIISDMSGRTKKMKIVLENTKIASSNEKLLKSKIRHVCKY